MAARIATKGALEADGSDSVDEKVTDASRVEQLESRKSLARAEAENYRHHKWQSEIDFWLTHSSESYWALSERATVIRFKR